MRKTDPEKHDRIVAAAARLFASRRFDQVRLEDVAAEAQVAKGTIYLHYKSKDDLYLSLLYEGFAGLVRELSNRPRPQRETAERRLSQIVAELVRFAFAHPHFFELSRRVGIPVGQPRWNRKRQELFQLIESEIRRGIARGELRDARPALTARYLPSMIRAAMLFPSEGVTPKGLTGHITGLLMRGLGR